jgi:hypothetical protein
MNQASIFPSFAMVVMFPMIMKPAPDAKAYMAQRR